mmetsp:Transcript_30119/g.67746  ORF Transcript_30119/g.67746 Transcript_30119/m.67746 type:complete len:197 (-) Transcript_30119:20-610(-)
MARDAEQGRWHVLLSIAGTLALVTTVFLWVLLSSSAAISKDSWINLLFAGIGLALSVLVVYANGICKPCLPKRKPASPSLNQWRLWAPCEYERLRQSERSLVLQLFRIQGTWESPEYEPQSPRTLEASALDPAAQVARVQDNETCSCCLDVFAQTCQVAVLPCGHVYHQACIASWSMGRSQNAGACPTCRGNFSWL